MKEDLGVRDDQNFAAANESTEFDESELNCLHLFDRDWPLALFLAEGAAGALQKLETFTENRIRNALALAKHSRPIARFQVVAVRALEAA